MVISRINPLVRWHFGRIPARKPGIKETTRNESQLHLQYGALGKNNRSQNSSKFYFTFHISDSPTKHRV